jgi:hypothetical protein
MFQSPGLRVDRSGILKKCLKFGFDVFFLPPHPEGIGHIHRIGDTGSRIKIFYRFTGKGNCMFADYTLLLVTWIRMIVIGPLLAPYLIMAKP